MDKVPRAALAALLCLFLAACGDACGDEEAEASRAGVRETERIVPSASPTPPAEEPGPASTPGQRVRADRNAHAIFEGTHRNPGQEVRAARNADAIRSGAGTRLLPRPEHPLARSRESGTGRYRTPPRAPPTMTGRPPMPGRTTRHPPSPSTAPSHSPTPGGWSSTRRAPWGRLAVEEGQAVTAGQPLAHMDRATEMALEGALAQAQVDASKAREALADVLAPPSPLEIARAEAKVSDAGESLRTAEERLLSLLRPTDREMAAAESVHADTVLKIDALRREIDSLVGGPDEKELEHLRVHARSDQVVLENALRGESLAEEEWDARIGRASRDVEIAAEEYRAFFLEWLGVEAHDVDANLDPDALLRQWGADLESLYGQSRVDLRKVSSIPANDPGTPWNEFTIWAYTNLVPFVVRADCGGSASTIEVICLSDEMAKVWDGLLAVRTNLHSQNTQADTALALAHNAVDEARDAVALNAEELEDLLAPPDPLLIRSKEKELALAETSLAGTEALLADMQERRELGLALELPTTAPGTGEVIDTAMLDDVSESLGRELLAAQKDIEDAMLDLWVAKESLEALSEPADPVLLALRQAQLASAELDVEAASRRLMGVTLTSSIAGVVTEIFAQAGEHVDRGDLAMTVVDPTVVEMRGAVDETGVLHVRVGAPASVLLRALPGLPLTGTVSYVSHVANEQPGAVTYDVRIALESPPGTELRSGLTAVAEVVLRSGPRE